MCEFTSSSLLSARIRSSAVPFLFCLNSQLTRVGNKLAVSRTETSKNPKRDLAMHHCRFGSWWRIERAAICNINANRVSEGSFVRRWYSSSEWARCSRPARLPYSYSDSMLMWRAPTKGCAPMISDRKISEAGSPCRTLFSAPSDPADNRR